MIPATSSKPGTTQHRCLVSLIPPAGCLHSSTRLPVLQCLIRAHLSWHDIFKAGTHAGTYHIARPYLLVTTPRVLGTLRISGGGTLRAALMSMLGTIENTQMAVSKKKKKGDTQYRPNCIMIPSACSQNYGPFLGIDYITAPNN